MSDWCIYLIECQGGSLYTGISNDVGRRYRQHLSGKGARYTRAHPPQQLIWAWPLADHSTAAKAEVRVRRLPPARKRSLTLADVMQLLEVD